MRIPAAWLSSIGGSAMGTKSYTIAIVIALVIVSLTIIGIVGYKAIVKKHERESKKNE